MKKHGFQISMMAALLIAGCAEMSGWEEEDWSEDETMEEETTGSLEATASVCIPSGGWDDTLSLTRCCSGVAVKGTTVCANAADFGTTWKTCNHVCGTARTSAGCIPAGGIDDTLGLTTCCSGAAVPGSTHCLNPADFGTTWKSCVQTCK